MKSTTPIRYVIIGILCAITLGTYYWYKKTAMPKNSNTFVVGTSAGYAPWVSVDQNGDYEGFDVDVMHALATQMDKTLVIKDLGSMPSLFIALEQNKIDAIIWGISITPDRLKKVAMIRYQGEPITSFPLLFWEKIPENIIRIEDMAGKVVCVEPASSQESVLNSYPSIITLPIEKIDDALLNIQYGKADAAFVEPAIAKKFKNKYPQIQILEVPLPAESQANGVGICVQKNNTQLIDEVTHATEQLLENGTIEKFEKKWDIT